MPSIALLLSFLLLAAGSPSVGWGFPSVGWGTSNSPPRSAEDEALSKLKVRLRDRDKWVRKGAVEKLARLDRPEAWEEVIEALGDDQGEVADTAQLLLGDLSSKVLLGQLFGKAGLGARDEWVRRRTAELLGRVPLDLEGGKILRALGDRDPTVRRMLLWSVERQVRAGRFLADRNDRIGQAVRRIAERDRDGGVRARALFALEALDPLLAAELVRGGANDRAVSVRCAVCALAPRLLGPEAAVALLRPRATDESIAVRTQTVDSLAAVATLEAVGLLVDRVGAEEERRLSWRLVGHLQRLTGQRHRLDPRPWGDWLARQTEAWVPVPPPETLPEMGGERSVALAGMPILSGRIAFLIDLSGSAWREREDGRTVKEIVDEKLRLVLEGIPEDTLFNVILFTSKPIPWREELAPATRRNVRRAVTFLEECREVGTGNVWDAMMFAMEDPAVDTLLVLSDGLPTGGRRHRLELIGPLFEELNVDRKVVVDSILVRAPRKLREQWADLSRRTGGLSIAVDL
jgi:hypothetical protein